MRTTISCPNCRTHIQAIYGENRWVKWIKIECYWCGYKHLMKEDELAVIQPTSPLWKLVYKNDPFKEYETNKKKDDWEKEKHKEYLDAKYDKQFKKPWERKFVKEKVLEEK